jgi:hypothetical protein
MIQVGKKLLLLAGSILLLLFILEVGVVRPWAFGSAAFSVTRMNSLGPLGHSKLTRPSNIPGLWYEFKPNLDAIYQLAPFKTNSHGMPDVEVSIEKPQGTYRVAVLGDSVSMAYGVPHELNYHSRLETHLNQSKPYLRFEFLNFAVGGYGLPQYTALLKHKVLQFDPDMIMVGVYLNDFLALSLQQQTHAKPRLSIKVPPVFTCYLWQFLSARSIRGRAVHQPDKNPDIQNKGIQTKIKAATRWLRKINEVGIKNRIPVTVVLLGHMATQEMLAYYEPASQIRLPGMWFIPAWKSFIGYSPREFWIHPFDSHPNKDAHELFEKEIYQGMSKAGLWPEAGYIQKRQPPDQLLKEASPVPLLKSEDTLPSHDPVRDGGQTIR